MTRDGHHPENASWKTALGEIEPAKRHVARVEYEERYFLSVADRVEVEVTQEEFTHAERAAGFHPTGPWPIATGGFSHGTVRGRVETLWLK